jgi:hypothetical protein
MNPERIARAAQGSFGKNPQKPWGAQGAHAAHPTENFFWKKRTRASGVAAAQLYICIFFSYHKERFLP